MPKSFLAKIIVLVIGLIVIGVPLYVSLFGSIYWFYIEAAPGRMQMAYLTHPDFIWHTWLALAGWWHGNADRMPAQMYNTYLLRLFAPPGVSLVTSLLILFFMRAPLIDFRPNFKKKEALHGDAHWASEPEIRAARLRSRKGLMLGRTGRNNYLVADDYQHVLLFAPTGSGKGVGFVIPTTCLFWEDSVICHDIKGENYELTSGYRFAKIGQQVYFWNPADPDGYTHCYNPLDWISDKPGQMVDDSQKICNLILPEQEFWQNEARSLLLGVILYHCAVPDKVCSFGEVVRTMRSDDVVYSLAVVLDTIGKKIHPVAYMNIAAFLQKADKERSGVVSTLNSGLELWANPLIDTATATSDFNIQDMKKKKITVYCGVTPDNLQRLEPLLQVFYQQCTDFMTRHMPRKGRAARRADDHG